MPSCRNMKKHHDEGEAGLKSVEVEKDKGEDEAKW
jgi:hypothetical protein